LLGDADSLIPAAEVAAIRSAMTMANGGIPPENPEAHHRLWCAPQAGHGYLCEARADFKADQALIAWDAMLELFEERVGGL
jgi:carboxymethylenebutenolidase